MGITTHKPFKMTNILRMMKYLDSIEILYISKVDKQTQDTEIVLNVGRQTEIDKL